MTRLKTTLIIKEFADQHCQSLLSTIEFSGPGGQGAGQDVFGLKFEDVSVTANSAEVANDLNAGSKALCNNNWQIGQKLTISGRSTSSRQLCIGTVGDISGPASYVKKLVLSYLFSPPLP